MSIELKLRQGTKAQNDLLVGGQGELTYCTDTKSMRIHDGTTIGGFPVGVSSTKKIDVVVDWQQPTETNNYTWYRKYKSGWVEQGSRITSGSTDSNQTVNLPVKMANTSYYCNLTSNSTTNTFNLAQPNWVTSRTVTSFTAHIDAFAPDSTDWEVKGMAA